MSEYEFKIASRDDEFEAIHSLNYETFVNEIPQHKPNKSRKLIDKYHPENTYFICLKEGELVAMVAGRTNRPFSLDSKVDELDTYLPMNSAPVEVRLLSVKQAYRKTRVCAVLIEKLCTYYAEKGQDLGLISATTRESRLYRRLGFQKFGPLVGDIDAQYQPMYLTTEKYKPVAKKLDNIAKSVSLPLNLQPGPVTINQAVQDAMSLPPISHRSSEFDDLLRSVTEQLCNLISLPKCYFLQGAGTLANEVIAAQLSRLEQRGLILVNGEFGERLVNQANRWELGFDVIDFKWGNSFDLEQIEERLRNNQDYGWVWFVGLETSVGSKNPYKELLTLAERHNIKCCIDAISLIGSEKTDFSSGYLVSGTSGKALGSYSGLAFVATGDVSFAGLTPVPTYLDLSVYEEKNGVPFTLSSNLLVALNVALTHTHWLEKFKTISAVSKYLNQQLIERDIKVINQHETTMSSLITIELPHNKSAVEVANRLLVKGYLVYDKPSYLVKRNWIQICLYSVESLASVIKLPEVLQTEIIEA